MNPRRKRVDDSDFQWAGCGVRSLNVGFGVISRGRGAARQVWGEIVVTENVTANSQIPAKPTPYNLPNRFPRTSRPLSCRGQIGDQEALWRGARLWLVEGFFRAPGRSCRWTPRVRHWQRRPMACGIRWLEIFHNSGAYLTRSIPNTRHR